MTSSGAPAAVDRFEEALRFAGEVGAAFDPRADAALVEEVSQNFDAARGAHAARQLELRRAVQSLAELLRAGEESARRPRPAEAHSADVAALSAQRDALSAAGAAGRAEAAALADAWQRLDDEAQALQCEAERVADLEAGGVPALAAKARLYAALTNAVFDRATVDAASAAGAVAGGSDGSVSALLQQPSSSLRLRGFVVYPEAGDAQTFDFGCPPNPDAFWKLATTPPSS